MIINTFYMLYKSNAEEAIKKNKEVEKTTKDITKSVKEASDESKKFGEGFIKAVEGLATASALWTGFNIIKSGINDATAYNAQLKQMGDLSGQTAQTLKTMGQAAAAAGGSVGGALADIQNLTNQANAAGLALGPADKAFDVIRDRIKGRSLNEKQATLSRFGISDPGNRWLLSVASDEEYQRRMGSASKRSRLSGDEANAAFNKIESDANLTGSQSTLYTKLGNIYNKITGKYKDVASDNLALTGLDTVAGTAIKAVGGVAIAKMIASRVFGTAAASATGAAATGSAVTAGGTAAVGGGALAAGVAAGYYGLGLFSKPLEDMLTKYTYKPVSVLDTGLPPLTQAQKTGNTGLDFWVAKGYTPAQAAGIMANVQHESGGDPMARGDGGRAHGLFQWHPDRRKSILAATGIDVSTAGYNDQLEAAAWEMKNGRAQFDDDHFRKLSSPDQAASYFSRKFEAPANGLMQALSRGKTALGMASRFSSSFGGAGGGSVKIDKIEIVTQATDAKGIAGSLKEELYSALGFLAANHDDGEGM